MNWYKPADYSPGYKILSYSIVKSNGQNVRRRLKKLSSVIPDDIKTILKKN